MSATKLLLLNNSTIAAGSIWQSDPIDISRATFIDVRVNAYYHNPLVDVSHDGVNWDRIGSVNAVLYNAAPYNMGFGGMGHIYCYSYLRLTIDNTRPGSPGNGAPNNADNTVTDAYLAVLICDDPIGYSTAENGSGWSSQIIEGSCSFTANNDGTGYSASPFDQVVACPADAVDYTLITEITSSSVSNYDSDNIYISAIQQLQGAPVPFSGFNLYRDGAGTPTPIIYNSDGSTISAPFVTPNAYIAINSDYLLGDSIVLHAEIEPGGLTSPYGTSGSITIGMRFTLRFRNNTRRYLEISYQSLDISQPSYYSSPGWIPANPQIYVQGSM